MSTIPLRRVVRTPTDRPWAYEWVYEPVGTLGATCIGRAREMRRAGRSLREVAKRLGVSKSGLQRQLKGIAPNRASMSAERPSGRQRGYRMDAAAVWLSKHDHGAAAVSGGPRPLRPLQRRWHSQRAGATQSDVLSPSRGASIVWIPDKEARASAPAVCRSCDCLRKLCGRAVPAHARRTAGTALTWFHMEAGDTSARWVSSAADVLVRSRTYDHLKLEQIEQRELLPLSPTRAASMAWGPWHLRLNTPVAPVTVILASLPITASPRTVGGAIRSGNRKYRRGLGLVRIERTPTTAMQQVLASIDTRKASIRAASRSGAIRLRAFRGGHDRPPAFFE